MTLTNEDRELLIENYIRKSQTAIENAEQSFEEMKEVISEIRKLLV